MTYDRSDSGRVSINEVDLAKFREFDLEQLSQTGLVFLKRREVHSPRFKVDHYEVRPTASGIAAIEALDSEPVEATEAAPVLQALAAQTEVDALKKHRTALLASYKDATGVESDSAIYDCAGKGTHSCHKPEFMEWKKGILPASSQTAISRENFLKERRKPLPKYKSTTSTNCFYQSLPATIE